MGRWSVCAACIGLTQCVIGPTRSGAAPIRIVTDHDTGEMFPVLPDDFVPPVEGEDYDYDSLIPDREQWEKYSSHTLQKHLLSAADPETRARWDEELATLLRAAAPGRRMQIPNAGTWGGPWGILDAAPNIPSSTVHANATRHNGVARTEFGAELGSTPVPSAGTATSFRCDDIYATNPTELGPCTYDCASLKATFYSAEMDENIMLPAGRPGNSDTVKCYLYNDDNCSPSESESCFKLDGTGPDIFALKQSQLDYYVHLNSDSLGPWNFRVGDDVCTVVQIITSALLDETPAGSFNASDLPPGSQCHQEEDQSIWCNTTVERCLPDGVHHHEHDVQNASQRVTVVGGNYQGTEHPLGTTEGTRYNVGECEDVVVRITTLTAPSSGSSQFSLIGANTSAPPTTFQTTRSDGVEEEFVFCMYDNPSYTLTPPDGWSGSVKVVSVAPDNTIEIPPTESWIVQGKIGADGLPVKLNARFKSGSFFNISHANLVFRYFRVSAQVAPLDSDSGHRTYSTRILAGDPTARIGGALHCKQRPFLC